MIFRLVKSELGTARICFCNFVINALPDTWLSSRVLRPWLASRLGLKLGKRCLLRKGTYFGNLGNVEMGNRCGINREVFFDALGKITLGNNVGVGFRVVFNTSTHEIGDANARVGALKAEPITVEDGVWIGANAYIGPGVSLGAGCVVASGAVVLRDVPPNVVVSGAPARVIKRLDANEATDEQPILTTKYTKDTNVLTTNVGFAHNPKTF